MVLLSFFMVVLGKMDFAKHHNAIISRIQLKWFPIRQVFGHVLWGGIKLHFWLFKSLFFLIKCTPLSILYGRKFREASQNEYQYINLPARVSRRHLKKHLITSTLINVRMCFEEILNCVFSFLNYIFCVKTNTTDRL